LASHKIFFEPGEKISVFISNLEQFILFCGLVSQTVGSSGGFVLSTVVSA